MKLEQQKAIFQQGKRAEFTKQVKNIRIVIKYLKVHHYVRHLDLTDCNISDGMLAELVEFLINSENVVLESLNLENNKLANDSTNYLAEYIGSNSDLVRLNLDKNPKIDTNGFFTIIKSLEQSISVQHLSFLGCLIKVEK
jgi:hypothetical protein